MNTNIIAFDRTRKPANRVLEAAQAKSAGERSKIVSISEWKRIPRARRTATGVFFTTGVLLTYGNVA